MFRRPPDLYQDRMRSVFCDRVLMRDCIGLLLVALMAVVLLSCSHRPVVHEGQPRMPDEAKNAGDSSTPPTRPADNSRCHVCHINYEDEELALQHVKANIGCVACHGESYAHTGDEANVTPPDIMYPKERINPSCLKCHATEKLSDVHKPTLAGTAEEKYCTDCHGEHRLGYRAVRWDKATGALLKEK